jgi:hypothetical protein
MHRDVRNTSSFAQSTMIGSVEQQKPRFCPMCGAKNKANL